MIYGCVTKHLKMQDDVTIWLRHRGTGTKECYSQHARRSRCSNGGPSWAWDVICAATYQGMLEECGSIHWVCLTIKRGALHDFQKFWTNLMQFETFLVEREISSINHQFSRAANAVVPKYCSTSPSVLVWSIQRCKSLTVDRQFEQLNDSIWRQGWLLSREVLQALHCFCVRIRQASHFLWVALVGMVPICSRSLKTFWHMILTGSSGSQDRGWPFGYCTCNI